ncbi:hypothetical protein D3C79_986110 [compost metagenome]
MFLQGALRLGTLVYQFAQVAVPEHHAGQQQRRKHQHLQCQCAVVAPWAVADHGADTPAIDQLIEFFRRDAQQGFVENGLQLRLVRGDGECCGRRVITEHSGYA